MAQSPKVIDAECANVIEFWKDMSVATDRIREIVSDIEKLHNQFQFNSRQNAAQSETFSRAVRALYSSRASEMATAGLPETPMNQPVVTSPFEYDRGDESRRITGNVVKSQPGFGFIEAANRTKVFLHVSEFSDGTSEMPPVGTLVNYELASTVKGPRAKSVRIVVT